MKRRILIRAFTVALAGAASACEHTTAPIKAVDLTIEPAEVNMIVGTAVPVSVSVVHVDGSMVLVPPRSAVFRSSNERVVLMSPDSAGLVMATGMGETDVMISVAVDGGRTLNKRLRVFVGEVTPPLP